MQTKRTKKLEKVRTQKAQMPKRPQTPYGLYYLSELQNFKNACKEKWTQLSDKKKIVFITEAQEQYKEYEKEYKKFIVANPELARQKFTKPVLLKQDIVILERAAGKPNKPPRSLYSYFASVNLLTEEIKNLPKKERFVHISVLWKEMPDDEKRKFKEQWISVRFF